ncbi:MAG: bifunctional ADP-dependent NAD(P)H-hydrate dehydratase/NAD(P)H-hydrate epimerase, partial [Chloroflexi bacterium]|nr:bifunctional ADP-dependent NAD(P)H-hydrate dehydratase/NAD(P)H-hydrate epimerase [Chloroflexota bacterium]
MKIVTVKEMRRLEESASNHGISTDDLMERAGLAVAQEVRKALRTVAGKRVLVLVGPGNNGGDGLVAARHLARWGASVTAYLATKRQEEDPKLDLALREEVTLSRAS